MGTDGRRVRRYLAPPHGPQVRRLVAWLTLAVGLPRLPLPWPTDGPAFAPLRFLPPEAYGVLMTALGVALMVTAYRGRLSVVGRLVAAAGFVQWMMLAAATPSATSLLIDLAVASVLLAEVWTVRAHDE